jgi:excisionase family DNA binding protein
VEYMTVKEAAEKWGISDRRVRMLCEHGEIDGVIRKGQSYLIPADAIRPVDGRSLRHKKITREVAEILARVDAKRAELNRRRPLTEGELERLQQEFLIEFTYSSNAIEGNTLTLKETALVLEGLTIDQKPLKDHLEAVGHRDAFLYLQKLIEDNVKFSERIIKEIHSLVLIDRPQDKGVYRRIPVKIAGAYNQLPEPHLVPEKMEQLVKEFFKTKLHPIEKAARFHLEFEGIHPFIDGNGRTGRLILNFTLMQNGYPPINVKFSDRKRYYDSFDVYFRDNDPIPMIQMVAEYVEEQVDRYLRILA